MDRRPFFVVFSVFVGTVPSSVFVGVVPSVVFVGVVPSVIFVGVVPSVVFLGVVPSPLVLFSTLSLVHLSHTLSHAHISRPTHGYATQHPLHPRIVYRLSPSCARQQQSFLDTPGEHANAELASGNCNLAATLATYTNACCITYLAAALATNSDACGTADSCCAKFKGLAATDLATDTRPKQTLHPTT